MTIDHFGESVCVCVYAQERLSILSLQPLTQFHVVQYLVEHIQRDSVSPTIIVIWNDNV